MVYNPEEQYRCTIIRGKSKSSDDILPACANIIEQICPCQKEDFVIQFDARMSEILNDSTKKTLDNHRTEIAGKLFGMYYEEDGVVFPSERTQKYLTDNDQPAFFKDICFKFQFPNGMDSLSTVREKMSKGISLRQYPFILRLLLLAKIDGIEITKNDIRFYILNSLHVLQGKVAPETVLSKIKEDREKGIIRTVRIPGNNSSFDVQHLNEQINYLEFTNLVKISDEIISLNMREEKAITYMAGFWDKPIPFDAYKYNLDTTEGKIDFYRDWQLYFSKVSEGSEVFETTIESLSITPVHKGTTVDKLILGDEGEMYIFEYEKQRVCKFNPRLVSKVIALGKTKGLGYDIQSVIAEEGEEAEFVKYIEVKSTKRVTVPDLKDNTWIDTINLTRNEWVAATQHKDFYSIYRIYFTPGEIIVYVINDVYEKNKKGTIRAVPLNYRVDFGNEAIDYKIDDIQRKEGVC